METDAEYSAAAKAIESVMFPFSFMEGEYTATAQDQYDEFERREQNACRYPHGFRHYENYHLYQQVYPDATLDDYTLDVNSQVTFEEFKAIASSCYMYNAKYNPQFMIDQRFDRLNTSREDQKA